MAGKSRVIAINEYQLGEYEECIECKNSAIILSEKDKLLKFDF